MRAWLLALVVGCGGGPVLRNAPKPDPSVVAGAAAALAGAATLADPTAAAKRVEANKVDDEKRPQRVKATVPSDVLDRVDQQPVGDRQLLRDPDAVGERNAADK
jgi:hypothetical protein